MSLVCGPEQDKEGDRRGHTLFIDARKLGSLIDRTHKDFFAMLYEQFAESRRLEAEIKKNLEVLGYGE